MTNKVFSQFKFTLQHAELQFVTKCTGWSDLGTDNPLRH